MPSEFTNEVIAGTVGGWAQVAIGHPFDTVKVLLQTNSEYKSALNCLQRTVQSQGIFSLYKGSLSPFVGFGICNAVVFSANGHFRRQLSTNDNQELSLGKIILAGGCSGAVVSIINCPFELVKNTYKNVIDCGFNILKNQGIRGLYRGFPITIARDIPSFASYFGMYEGLKRFFKSQDISGKWTLLVAGGIAGIAAWLPGYPQDLVKSRIQCISGPYKTIDIVKQTFKTSGMMGFFRGLSPTIVRAVPVNAAVFYVYEWTMMQLN